MADKSDKPQTALTVQQRAGALAVEAAAHFRNLDAGRRNRLLAAVALSGCGDDGKPYGDPCTSNDECASDVCGGGLGPRTCACASDDDCPSGETCRMTTDIGNRCTAAGIGSN